MVALRGAAPERYPQIRTAFVLLHIPALIAIGAFPLASPSGLPHPHRGQAGIRHWQAIAFPTAKNLEKKLDE